MAGVRQVSYKGETIKQTDGLGFCRVDCKEDLKEKIKELLAERREYFSSMQTRADLGRIIEVANNESTYEKKAEKFLELIRI